MAGAQRETHVLGNQQHILVLSNTSVEFNQDERSIIRSWWIIVLWPGVCDVSALNTLLTKSRVVLNQFLSWKRLHTQINTLKKQKQMYHRSGRKNKNKLRDQDECIFILFYFFKQHCHFFKWARCHLTSIYYFSTSNYVTKPWNTELSKAFLIIKCHESSSSLRV